MNKETELRLCNPGAEYRGKPFWSWNGALEEEELLRQIDVMKEMGFGGYFMHSRTGLITEYLGEKWFSLIRKCSEYGYEHGMESWIYDEDRWPSGTCGGLVTRNKEYRLRFLSEYESDEAALANPDVVRIVERYALRIENGCLKEAKRLEAGEKAPAGYRYAVYAEELMHESDFYNGTAYLDTMNGEAVQEYLNSTLDAHTDECGDMLGKQIKGVFTDEPHRGALFNGFGILNGNRANMIPYTGKLFEAYKAKYGEELCVPEIYYLTETDAKNETAKKYIDVLDDLFTQNFAQAYAAWCKEHNIIFTGHILHEDSLSIQTSLSGSMMRFYEYMDYPGIDNLSAHNGCYWAAIQCASVARQMGKPFVLSELYGCTGWDMPLSEYKRIGDWHALFGINLRCPHLSWYTMKGEAKRDYPTSILHQNAWYKDWKLLEDYFARIGIILTEGKRTAELLVIHPVERMWEYVRKGWMDGFVPADRRIEELDSSFISQCMQLIEAQQEFDYGDEELLAKYASVGRDEKGAYLKVGRAIYRTVLLAKDQAVRDSTKTVLDAFVEQGGKVVQSAEQLDAAAVLRAPVQIASAVREMDGETWLFLLNLSETQSTSGEVIMNERFNGFMAEEWDLTVFEKVGVVSLQALEFAPGQMRIFRMVKQSSVKKEDKKCSKVSIPEKMRYELSEPNVLVLDFAQYSLDGKMQEGGKAKEILKIDRILRAKFGLPMRGGEMVQPWFAKKYLADNDNDLANVKLVFTFESDVDRKCILAAEYDSVSINGAPALHIEGRWVDSCFHLYQLPVKKGKNEICVELKFKRSENLEAMYVLGDFAVELPNRITKLPDTLSTSDIGAQGLPFYSGAITYFTEAGGDLHVKVKELHGASLHLIGNADEKIIAFPPYEADIQADKLALKVYFTRRNTFGPFHLTPQPQGSYGPESFITEGENWTDDYVLIKQGFAVEIGR